ncbi:capsular biosynthesis protein [Halobacillus halophilus]|uniref:PGA biosynthesis protein CapA n=1 Tax=Halobacillus halophilus (strain ATCC 35676 / DSM 2266 / JCM 20832 / KCTC 3685 / LMG 17431 / NBRC 102448 / NCIMB 2269) TaxID=866895 RepID=I0JR03_HALH3|nr:CapA family protein [Halobacillus halophilus]ASF40573.1 capsular biosynthesis protein [Halobacillus halophilus]CCG46573.1 PGA biosynthesis protein CapA [Halobacillus halophilus DSM 2266]
MSMKLSYQEKFLQKIKKHKKSTNKHVIIGIIILFVFIVGFELFYKQPAPEAKEKENSYFSAAFVGDMMFGRNVKEVTERKGTDYLFEKVAPYFESADYVTGNFENPVTLEGKSYDEIDKSIHLSADPSAVEALKDANFSNVNLANNHAMDFGPEGLLDTVQTFEDKELDFVGAGKDLEAAQQIDYKKTNGLKIATLGFSDVYVSGFRALEYNPGIAAADPESFLPLVREAKENADMVVVNIHWGAEYDNKPHPRQQEMAKAIVGAGADVIIGHHPHVLSPVEVYDNSVIFYSLGNFIFDQGWSRTRDSALVNYDLMEDGTGRFEILPMRIRESRPAVTNNKYNQKKIFTQLKRGEPESNFTVENGKLVIEVDHSSILEEGELEEDE